MIHAHLDVLDCSKAFIPCNCFFDIFVSDVQLGKIGSNLQIKGSILFIIKFGIKIWVSDECL